jgi:hypothetical protein
MSTTPAVDTTKLKTHLTNAQTELSNIVDIQVKARNMKALPALGKIDITIEKALRQLEPKAKREKKSKGDKK